MTDLIRHDWTVAELRAIYDLPFPDLLYQAQTVHRTFHAPASVQLCTLLSVKTGGCPEDCAYCPQSAHYETAVGPEQMLSVETVLETARRARAAGASRFCMGAAWREVKDGPAFTQVLAMVRGISEMGMEACVTLGMLTETQAQELKAAGLTAYNHNLDTSPEFYGQIITTRSYDDRLRTLKAARAAGLELCSGGIIGMGESIDDRCQMLVTLANFDPHPESVPVNALVAVPGTPLSHRPPVDPLEFVRTIALARIAMPKSRVRLSAGRTELSREAQALAFVAGANSVFFGEKLLTTPNPAANEDRKLLNDLGLKAALAAHKSDLC